MKKCFIALLFLVVGFVGHSSAQTHTFCALDQNCTWTGNSIFKRVDGVVYADQYTTTDLAIAAAVGGYGVVLFTPSATEYSCPSSIPSNIALIGLGSFYDFNISGAFTGVPNDVTNTQVKLGPCGAITIAAGAQNIYMYGLTLDFNNSGNGLAFVSSSGISLERVSLINAGNNSTPILSLTATGGSGSFNSTRNTFDHVSLNGNQSSGGTNFTSAAIYLNAAASTFVTLNQFYDIAITGSMKCAIDLEKNTDTNYWFGININAASSPANSAPLCFNLATPASDQDADANYFSGLQNTAGGFSNQIRAGQTTGNVFWDSTIDTSSISVQGGANPQFSALTMGEGANGVNGAHLGTLKLLDQGNCTMSSGACTAINLSRAYVATPQCLVTWDGTGTCTGVLKCSTTTAGGSGGVGSATPASSVGSDTCHVHWVVLGY